MCSEESYEALRDPSEWTHFEAELGENGMVVDHIVHLRSRDGETLAMSVNAHVVMDDRGWPTGIDGVFRDVSERTRWRPNSRAMRDIEKKNEELESLIYSITHDFKSPLLVVGGW